MRMTDLGQMGFETEYHRFGPGGQAGGQAGGQDSPRESGQAEEHA
jgi:hypothetical protein